MEEIKAEDVYLLLKSALDDEPAQGAKGHLIYRSAKDEHVHRDQVLGKFILHALEKKMNKHGGLANLKDHMSGVPEEIAQPCLELQALIESAIHCIDNPSRGGLEDLPLITKKIFGVDSLLKPIIVLNDFLFLDKRKPIFEGTDEYKRFLTSTLNDLKLLGTISIDERHRHNSIWVETNSGPPSLSV